MLPPHWNNVMSEKEKKRTEFRSIIIEKLLINVRVQVKAQTSYADFIVKLRTILQPFCFYFQTVL